MFIVLFVAFDIFCCHGTVQCMQRSNIAPKVILAIQGPEIDTVNSRSNAREMILAIPRIDSMIIIILLLATKVHFQSYFITKVYNRTQFRIDKCILRFIGNCLQTCSTKLE